MSDGGKGSRQRAKIVARAEWERRYARSMGEPPKPRRGYYSEWVEGQGFAADWALTSPTEIWLRENVAPGGRYLDLGAGYSSLLFRCKTHDVVTVEDDEEWAARVGEMLLGFNPVEIGSIVTTAELLDPADDGPGQFDLIWVDHAPRERRWLDLPWIVELLAPDGVLLFDDYRRDLKHKLDSRLPAFGFEPKALPIEGRGVCRAVRQ